MTSVRFVVEYPTWGFNKRTQLNTKIHERVGTKKNVLIFYLQITLLSHSKGLLTHNSDVTMP